MRSIRSIDPFGHRYSMANQCVRELLMMASQKKRKDCPFEKFAELCLDAVISEGPMPMVVEKNKLTGLSDEKMRRAVEIMSACVMSSIQYKDVMKRVAS